NSRPSVAACLPPLRKGRHRDMQRKALLDGSRAVLAALLLFARGSIGAPAPQGSIAGTVLDPLNARVPGAAVALMRDGTLAAESTSDGHGQFAFSGLPAGRYRLVVRAAGF